MRHLTPRPAFLVLALLLGSAPAAAQPQRFSLDPRWRFVRGDLRDLDPFASSQRRAFNGLALAIAKADTPGRLRLTASADGLRGATIDVQVRRGTPFPTLR